MATSTPGSRGRLATLAAAALLACGCTTTNTTLSKISGAGPASTAPAPAVVAMPAPPPAAPPDVPVPEATACSDFDRFVNGRWTDSTLLPPERARIGSFDTLRVANAQVLETALAELAAQPATQSTPGLRLLAAYYRSGMDQAAIERQGLAPVAPQLAAIGNATRDGLPALIGALARLQIAAPLSLSVSPDAKDQTRYVLNVQQAGLGLPDRDDYFRNDDNTRRLQQAYRVYAQRLLQAANAPADGNTIDALMALETELAQASATRVQRRDPNAGYNPLTLAQLQAQSPGFDWRRWLASYGGQAPVGNRDVGNQEAASKDVANRDVANKDAANKDVANNGQLLIVGQPAFTQSVARLAQTVPLATWQAYLRVHLLDATAEHLPRAVADAHFAYRSTAVRGLRQPLPRVEQIILSVGGNYGQGAIAESVGELYASKAFSPLAQRRAQQMLADIKTAMHQRIEQLPWMSDATKRLAQAKLAAMSAKIGVPDRWRTYDGLVLRPDSYAGNLLAANAWNTQQRLADLGQPVDRSRWTTSPHIVNAFAGGGNQIVFPAGILQPPFFDANADDASNYGAIGMVIGHEITHHFDDRGRLFDSVGNLRDWWLPQDAAAYQARAARVGALYSSYEPVPGVHINGALTMGENISDIGGVQIAYQGLQIALARQRAAGQPTPLIDGYTPEQRFFIANALVWRSKTRTEALVDQLRTDGHSPGRWRVLAPLSNMAAFAQAFGCKAGDGMVAAEPITIW